MDPVDIVHSYVGRIQARLEKQIQEVGLGTALKRPSHKKKFL